MDKAGLKRLIDVAAGRVKADTVIKNAKIVNVFSGKIVEGTIAMVGEEIAGIGDYEGEVEIDAKGQYAIPGLIDSHIHIESSHLSPEEFGKLVVPLGTTTVIADPHEIVNVAGVNGLNYMMNAAKNTALSVKFMIPSCVPATPFEHSGAIIDANTMKGPMQFTNVIGLGEFMNFVGVINADDEVLDKLMVAKRFGKIIDGHAPAIKGKELNAYSAVGIRGDHECSNIEELNDRLDNGEYILLRQGSACHDLPNLAAGVNSRNSRRCLLCSDDRQPMTILQEGHVNGHLRMCVELGIDAITAIQMATINAAECWRLEGRGAIAPGYRADVVLVDNLKDFNPSSVFIEGKLVAKDGEYLPDIKYFDSAYVGGSVNISGFTEDKLIMHLTSNHVKTIQVLKGGVVTGNKVMDIKIDENGEFVFDPSIDVAKIAIVERHHNTGFVGTGLLSDYGIKAGAVALTIAHDSHNIVVVGVNNDDMAAAVQAIKEQSGGFVLVKDGQVLERMPLPIGGLMTTEPGTKVAEKLIKMHEIAHKELGIRDDLEPFTTLCFMSLPVIPELKITDQGLFDVTKFSFTSVEAD